MLQEAEEGTEDIEFLVGEVLLKFKMMEKPQIAAESQSCSSRYPGHSANIKSRSTDSLKYGKFSISLEPFEPSLRVT